MEKTDKIAAGSFLRRLLKHSAPLGLFVVLPLIIAGFLGHQTLANERVKHIESVSSELEKNVVRAQYELDAATFLRKIGRGAWHKLRQHQADATAFNSYCQSLQRFIPVEFDLYAFDAKG
ncbi:MAG TPA: hypothetical protein DCG57_05175, partial [Candidatus Riflebacteria bacterium]|nr:hypothetical protein [Candidatus Riflebacteria bacterium]